MELLIGLILISNISIAILLISIHMRFDKFIKILLPDEDIGQPIQTLSDVFEVVEDKPSEYELAIQIRDEEFNERLRKLQEEIEAETAKRKGFTAEELHPAVKNLPHESVKSKFDLADYEEVAD